MRLRFPLALLALLFPLAATAAVIVGPERPVTADVALIPAGDNVLALASDGNDYLAVWGSSAFASGLHVSRVSAAGDVDHVPALPIDAHSPDSGAAAIWAGSAYLVVWNSNARLMSLTVDRNGVLQQPPRTLIGNVQAVWKAAFNGRHVLVIYEQSLRLRGAILDVDGSLVRDDIVIPAPALRNGSPGTSTYDVASDGNGFAVFWINGDVFGEHDNLSAVRVSDAGDLLDPAAVLMATMTEGHVNSDLAAAFDGHQYALAFTTTTSSTPVGEGPLRRVLVDPATLLTFFLPESLAVGGGLVHVIFDGAQALAFVSSLGQTMLVPYSTDSAVAVSVNGFVSAAATNGRSFLLGLRSPALGIKDRLALIDAAGNVIKDAFPFAYTPRSQTAPRMASSGDQSLMAWTESAFDSQTVLAVRIDATTRVIDAQPFAIASGAAVRDVVFAGSSYYVFFATDAGQFFVQRIGLNGALAGAPVLLPAEGAAATNGSNILVAVATYRPLAYRIDLDGNLLDAAPFTFSSLPDSGWVVNSRAVASNGSDYLVTFVGSVQPCSPFPCPGTAQRLFAARITGGGTPLDPTPIEVGGGTRGYDTPSVTWDGRDYVVGYGAPNAVGAPTAWTLEARKVLPNGTIDGDAVVLATQSGLVAVAHASFGTIAAPTTADGIALMMLDGGPLTLIPGASRPTMAPSAPGIMQLVYAREVNGSPRLFVRRVGEIAPRPRAARH